MPFPCLGMVKHHERLASQIKKSAFMNNPRGWTQPSATEQAHPGELLQVSSQEVFFSTRMNLTWKSPLKYEPKTH